MWTRKLDAADRPRALYVYSVRGNVTRHSGFPTDMLRYDGAWPHRSDDVYAITMRLGEGERIVTVELASYSPPTTDRWSSFGWTVLS